MSEKMTISDTVKPKSDQLNFDDVAMQSITVTVTKVTKSEGDQPVALHLDQGLLPYKPCKSMRRVLIHAWGDNGHDWVGRSLVLRGDPEVKYGGVKVGGIRISHLSHIEKPIDVVLTISRAKRQPYHVEPLLAADPDPEPPATYPESEFEKRFPAMKGKIESGEMTHDQVIARCEKSAPLTDAQKERINEAVPPQPETETTNTPEEF